MAPTGKRPATDLRPQRPQPQPARHAASRRSTARDTLDDIAAHADRPRRRRSASTLDIRQSNHEGHLIDWLHEARGRGAKAVILNAGGYTPYLGRAARRGRGDRDAGHRGPSQRSRDPRSRSATSIWSPLSRRASIKGQGARGYTLRHWTRRRGSDRERAHEIPGSEDMTDDRRDQGRAAACASTPRWCASSPSCCPPTI